ncbi:MAG: chemotaxis protein CheW [Planctomycetaceae bacterium]|nr:chemotaxis protein CheW [Planctomycetaceae bacterium]
MEDEIIHGFIEESWENLGQLDVDIVAFEKDTSNDELLAGVFRTIHTIKGTCGFIGLVRIGAVSHAAENVLGKMRDHSIPRTPEAITYILEAVDAIKELLQGLEATGEEPCLDHTALIDCLERVAHPEAESASLELEPTACGSEAPVQQEIGGENSTVPTAIVTVDSENLLTASGEVDFDALDRAINEAAARHREKMQNQAAKPQQQPAPAIPAPVGQVVSQPKGGSQDKSDDAKDAGEKKSVSDLSIRVSVEVLDQLMNLVGELVLARNQLIQLSRGDEASKYAAPLAHLNRITTDLQEGVMKTRMQPIGNAWNKLPRLVRDLSKVTGKPIELEMQGAETELDRTVLDAIKDPLTHMVRNSADHGLESPRDRLAAGKPETGTIRLNAYHEGGHVIICIEDDGAGINTEKVLNKLISQGLVSEADAEKLSEYEIHQYIFRAGFSTAEQVSSVSGRGVGMDVVRTEIERIGGMVDLISRRGLGTTVRIKIPLTLAIVSALVVESGGQSFAIPQLGIMELVLLTAEERNRIERVHDKQVYRLRNRLLPLVRLSDVLQIEAPPTSDGNTNIVVVQVGEEQMGLLVDHVFDTEEIVVKPVGLLLKEINIYQGTTILGDGRVIMILDVSGIASEFGSLNTSQVDRESSSDQERATNADLISLLVFDTGEQTMAVPLSLVSRLEEFPRHSIERSSNGHVIQYRGSLLPLQSIEGAPAQGIAELQPVIVFSDGEQSMGLMVAAIRDVVEEQLTISVQSKRPGLLGTAVINGQATEVINTQHYLLRTNPDWFRKSHPVHYRILVINSSAFFRQLLTTALRSEQYLTVAVDSVESALNHLEKDSAFDLVIVDFDQPEIQSGELIIWLREQQATASVSILGLCSRLTPHLEQDASRAGCHAVLEKLDITELTQAIERLCGPSHWNRGVSA